MKEKNKYYRNFGTLSNDSVVTDIYHKKFKNKNSGYAKVSKCVTRKMTDQEYEKYFGKKYP